MSSSSTQYELPDDTVGESPAAKRREKLKKECRLAAFRLNLTTGLFFLFVLGGLIFYYWVAQQVALRPQVQTIDLEHVSMQDWRATFRIEFPDAGLPPSVLAIAPAQRPLPRPIIGGNEEKLGLKKTPSKSPERLGLAIFVPEGALPGVYSGALVMRDEKKILPEQRLPMVIEVLDPLERFRWLLVYLACVTGLVLLAILWMNPRPFGHLRTLMIDRAVHNPASLIQTQELTANHRGKVMVLTMAVCFGALWWAFRGASSFDPRSTKGLLFLGFGVLLLVGVFAWTNPFGRKRISLKTFDDAMPEGEIEFSRMNPLMGNSRLSVVLRIWDDRIEEMKVVADWPASLLALEDAATAPPTRDLPHRRSLGLADIFVTPPDSPGGKTYCFQFLRELPAETL